MEIQSYIDFPIAVDGFSKILFSFRLGPFDLLTWGRPLAATGTDNFEFCDLKGAGAAKLACPAS